jgi:hypothetical protein
VNHLIVTTQIPNEGILRDTVMYSMQAWEVAYCLGANDSAVNSILIGKK